MLVVGNCLDNDARRWCRYTCMAHLGGASANDRGGDHTCRTDLKARRPVAAMHTVKPSIWKLGSNPAAITMPTSSDLITAIYGVSLSGFQLALTANPEKSPNVDNNNVFATNDIRADPIVWDHPNGQLQCVSLG